MIDSQGRIIAEISDESTIGTILDFYRQGEYFKDAGAAEGLITIEAVLKNGDVLGLGAVDLWPLPSLVTWID